VLALTARILAAGLRPPAAVRAGGYATRGMHDDEDDDSVAAAFGALHVDWELPAESRAVLLESLRSPDPEVRLEAVEMLAHSIDDTLAALALEIARTDREEEIRAAAASALAPGLAAAMAAAEEEDAPASPLSPAAFESTRQGLRHLYYDSVCPKEVRRRALEAAVQAPEAWQEGAVRAAWASDDAEWRTSALFCMSRLPGFEAELLDGLRDRQPAVRLEAARAVGDARLPGAVPRLLALAQAADEEPLVRMAAMESLGRLGAREAVEPLRELVDSLDPELAFAARTALARLSEEEAVDDAEGDDDPF
jgi:HEAT repeat protein